MIAFRFEDLAGDLDDVPALVAVLGKLDRLSAQLQIAGRHTRGEDVHLNTGVVDVELALHLVAGVLEHARQRVTERRPPTVPDMHGSDRIGRDELHLPLLSRSDVASTEVGTFLARLAQARAAMRARKAGC